MKILLIVLTLLYVLNVPHAAAAPTPWQKLTPTEQVALAPLYPQWQNLPETQQNNLRRLAQRYHSLDADAKRRFLTRLATWAQLTPAQRQAAREKYHAFNQLPHEKREQVKQIIKHNQIVKSQTAVDAAASSPTASATALPSSY